MSRAYIIHNSLVSLDSVANTLREWGSRETLIRRLWIYGSYATGTAKSDSDLDVAVEILLTEAESGDKYSAFVCAAEDWRSELAAALTPYKLDLKFYDTSGVREKVRLSVDTNGILVYERTP